MRQGCDSSVTYCVSWQRSSEAGSPLHCLLPGLIRQGANTGIPAAGAVVSIDRQPGRERGRQAGRGAGRQAGRQASRETGKQEWAGMRTEEKVCRLRVRFWWWLERVTVRNCVRLQMRELSEYWDGGRAGLMMVIQHPGN